MVMRIRILREVAELKQEEVAAQMGVDRTTVNKWETEVALPRARQIPLLAQVLQCTIGDLFAEECASA